MRHGLDEYAHLDSRLHHWEPRCKFVGLVALIFAFSFVQDLRLLPVMLTVTAGVYGVSRMPLSFLLTRLRAPGFFIDGRLSQRCWVTVSISAGLPDLTTSSARSRAPRTSFGLSMGPSPHTPIERARAPKSGSGPKR